MAKEVTTIIWGYEIGRADESAHRQLGTEGGIGHLTGVFSNAISISVGYDNLAGILGRSEGINIVLVGREWENTNLSPSPGAVGC